MQWLPAGEPLDQAGHLGELLVKRPEKGVGSRRQCRQPAVAQLLGEPLHLRQCLVEGAEVGLAPGQAHVANALDLALHRSEGDLDAVEIRLRPGESAVADGLELVLDSLEGRL